MADIGLFHISGVQENALSIWCKHYSAVYNMCFCSCLSGLCAVQALLVEQCEMPRVDSCVLQPLSYSVKSESGFICPSFVSSTSSPFNLLRTIRSKTISNALEVILLLIVWFDQQRQATLKFHPRKATQRSIEPESWQLGPVDTPASMAWTSVMGSHVHTTTLKGVFSQ